MPPEFPFLATCLRKNLPEGICGSQPAACLGSARTPERYHKNVSCSLSMRQARGQAVYGHPIYPEGVDFVLFPFIRQNSAFPSPRSFIYVGKSWSDPFLPFCLSV